VYWVWEFFDFLGMIGLVGVKFGGVLVGDIGMYVYDYV